MNQPNTVRLEAPFPFSIRPDQLLGVDQRLPVVNFYVPLYMLDVTFDGLVVPRLEPCGNGAVRMSLDEPFGFMKTSGRRGTIKSQKTNEIVIAPTQDPDVWDGTFATPSFLTDEDIVLFSMGIQLYGHYVQRKLSQKTASP